MNNNLIGFQDMKIDFLFAWYDLWIGFFWDKKKKWLYILPIPMFGIILKFEDLPADYRIEKGMTNWVGEGERMTYTVFWKEGQLGAYRTRKKAIKEIKGHQRYIKQFEKL